MLNKGPHILLALDFLCDLLGRMEAIRRRNPLSCASLAWRKWLGTSEEASPARSVRIPGLPKRLMSTGK